MSGKLHQIHTAVAAGFGSLAMGALNVWPSYTASIYTSNATTPLAVPMTQAEESLLGSLPSLGAMLGTAAAGPVLNWMGRRNGGVVLSLPFVLSWAMISVSSTTNMVLAARFLGGLACGANLILGPIFISETSEDSIRGALSSALILMYCMGTVFSYITGYFLTYKVIIWLNMVLGLLCTLLLMMVVESPVYLLRKNRDEDARVSIAKYRGVSVSSMIVADEFSRLKQQIIPPVELITVTDADTKAEESEKERLNTENIVPEKIQSVSPIKLLFVSGTSRRAFIIVLTVITLQVFMGIVPVQVYANTVFMQTDPGRADLYTVVFSLVMLGGSAVTTVVADKAGRRVLIMLSSVIVCVCMTSLGFLINNKDVSAMVTVFFIFTYCFGFLLGAGTIPYVLLAELFISEVQSVASIIIIEWVWFLNFFILAVFPYMLNTIGIDGTFFTFAGVSVANAVLSYFIVPETKGLSLEQIQDRLSSRKKK